MPFLVPKGDMNTLRTEKLPNLLLEMGRVWLKTIQLNVNISFNQLNIGRSWTFFVEIEA